MLQRIAATTVPVHAAPLNHCCRLSKPARDPGPDLGQGVARARGQRFLTHTSHTRYTLCDALALGASSICTSMLTGSLVDNYPPKKVMDPIQLSLSLGEIAVRSHRLMVDFLTRRPELTGLGDPAGIGQAFLQLTAKIIADPMSIAQAQLELWADHMKLWQRTTERLFDPTGKSDRRPLATDRRFQHSAWTENILFDYIKQSYLISAEAILSAVSRVNGLNPKTAHKVDFYTRQFVDAMSPSNFLATNPEVLQTTIETGGENLLRGLTNLLDDLERGRGQLAVTMTDLKAFRLGESVAATPGKVIFQNELMQVI
jgi:poly[(R)-3-hydroxyalkanoate] polymerase subunit PhaC